MPQYDGFMQIVANSGQHIGTISIATSKATFEFQRNSQVSAPESGQFQSRLLERQPDSLGRKWYQT